MNLLPHTRGRYYYLKFREYKTTNTKPPIVVKKTTKGGSVKRTRHKSSSETGGAKRRRTQKKGSNTARHISIITNVVKCHQHRYLQQCLKTYIECMMGK